jgi:hypothetical protein
VNNLSALTCTLPDLLVDHFGSDVPNKVGILLMGSSFLHVTDWMDDESHYILEN